MPSQIYLIVDPSHDSMEKPTIWNVYRDKIQIGNVYLVLPERIPRFEMLHEDRGFWSFDLSIEDLSRIVNFMKGFPDPVLQELPIGDLQVIKGEGDGISRYNQS